MLIRGGANAEVNQRGFIEIPLDISAPRATPGFSAAPAGRGSDYRPAISIGNHIRDSISAPKFRDIAPPFPRGI